MKSAQLVKGAEVDSGTDAESGDRWLLNLDREQKIIGTGGVCPSCINRETGALSGRKLAQIGELAFLHSLLAKGFYFCNLPVVIAGAWLAADYFPNEEGEDGGGVLTLSALDQNNPSFSVMHDFVRSIDPITDEAENGVAVVDRSGTILLINQGLTDILGVPASALLGRPVHESCPNSYLSRLPQVMDSGQAEVGEPHLLNGRHLVVSRWPLIKNCQTVGAFCKTLFRDLRDAAGPAEKFSSGGGKPVRTGGSGTHGFSAAYDIQQIICHSPTMLALKEKLLRIAERSSTVLLTGESGTGKELFAHAIHAASLRRHGPLVRVNCAAIPENLLESELFGYVEGAFTGARRGGQVGKFEQAHGGTIFLDEISDMPMTMQAKLLRVLQEREVTPLGSHAVRHVDVRFIAATNLDIQQLVKEGRFRADLFYRLNVVSIAIPPLRERTADVFQLTRHFIEHFNAEFGLSVQGLDTQAWAALRGFGFPGNVRELRSAVESAFNVVTGPFIRLEDLPPHIAQAAVQGGRPEQGPIESLDAACHLGSRTLLEVMEQIEKDLIQKTLERAGGNKLNAAGLLGISRPGLYKKLQKYKLH